VIKEAYIIVPNLKKDKRGFIIRKNFAKYPQGHIALQKHSTQISFRYVKIKEL